MQARCGAPALHPERGKRTAFHAFSRTFTGNHKCAGRRMYLCIVTNKNNSIMALNYSISLRKNPKDAEAPAKAYATAQTLGTCSLNSLARRIASQTTVSRIDVNAVVSALVDNMFDVLQEGYQVDLGELGKFRLQIVSEGAESLQDFTSDNIRGVNVRFVPGATLKNIFTGMTFEAVPTREAVRKVLKAQKEGEGTVQLGID